LRQLREKSADSIRVFETEKQTGFWESEEGHRLTQDRLKNASLDRLLDEKLIEILETGNVVMDSWTMPWLSKKGFRIWLDVDDSVRMQRIASRDHMPLDKVREAVARKEETTRQIYRKTYGFEFGADKSVFNFVLNTTAMTEQQVEDAVAAEIRRVIDSGFFG
jgi:cytidylate kinase